MTQPTFVWKEFSAESCNCRDVRPFSESDLISRIDDFKSNGFINYFGTQRFGSCAFNTAEIGIAILKKKWEAALKAILKPRNAHGKSLFLMSKATVCMGYFRFL